MGSVLGELVPPALGIAVSPFPVVPAILLLFTVRPRATSGAFLAGWTSGIALAAGVFTTLATVVELNEETPTWVSWVKIVLGAALVAAGARQWFTRHRGTAPRWMRSVQQSTPASALRLGLLLSAANPKVLLLALAGGVGVGAAELPLPGAVGAVLVFTAIAACTVALPLVLHAALGDRILVPLRRAKDWLETHNAAVMAVVITVIGVLLLGEGAGGL
ncbi:GAP family protein [Streptomyces lydicus]|uniref:GAP family protein n=1 Tax=Streptomyces lydicus TaxID=47763 RepID=UPI0037B8BA57